MAKQVQVRYEHNSGALECRDLTVGRVYNAELPKFGEVDKGGAEVASYDELWIIEDDAGDGVVTRLCAGFVLVEDTVLQQDDPLPPAPESALYVNSWGWGVGVCNLGDEVQIGTGNPNSCNYGWTYATLDPDAALQLAHDLNRIANEIKRRERAQSGE